MQNNVFSFRMRSLLFIVMVRLNNLLLFFVPLLLFWRSSPSMKDISFVDWNYWMDANILLIGLGLLVGVWHSRENYTWREKDISIRLSMLQSLAFCIFFLKQSIVIFLMLRANYQLTNPRGSLLASLAEIAALPPHRPHNQTCAAPPLPR